MSVQDQLRAKSAELNRLADHAEGLQKRYTAHLLLYDAACMAGNEREVALRREECHTLLDDILDNTRAVHVRAAEVRALTQ